MEERDYSKNIVKEYLHWTVYVHINQSYLGRCIIWCKREEALDLSDANENEQTELFAIIKKLRIALRNAFNCDWLNYSFLGNEMRHLHCHVVPRYKEQQSFEGVIFRDGRWGHNWITDEKFVTSEELLQLIKRRIQDQLE